MLHFLHVAAASVLLLLFADFLCWALRIPARPPFVRTGWSLLGYVACCIAVCIVVALRVAGLVSIWPALVIVAACAVARVREAKIKMREEGPRDAQSGENESAQRRGLARWSSILVWPPRFNLRHVFLAITLLAAFFGAQRWFKAAADLDPASERFESNGLQYELTWTDMPWDSQGFISKTPDGHTIFTADFLKHAPRVPLEQELFRLSYADFFGDRIQVVRSQFLGSGDSFVMVPTSEGRGNLEGACDLTYTVDNAKSLRVRVHQTIYSRRSMREAELVYTFDGSTFHLDPEESKVRLVDQLQP